MPWSAVLELGLGHADPVPSLGASPKGKMVRWISEGVYSVGLLGAKAEIPVKAATSALRRGEPTDEASKQGKQTGSFSNMRFEIADMLDKLGLHAVLGLNSSEELFNKRYDLLHPTSCIRYPVFVWK